MLSAPGMMGLTFVVETLAEGTLRRHARVRLMIGPYFELVLPAMIVIELAGAVSLRRPRGELSQYGAYLLMLPLLVLALTGVRRKWHWTLRALLLGGWLAAFCAYIVMKFGSH